MKEHEWSNLIVIQTSAIIITVLVFMAMFPFNKRNLVILIFMGLVGNFCLMCGVMDPWKMINNPNLFDTHALFLLPTGTIIFVLTWYFLQ